MVLLVRTATSPKRRTMVPHTLVMRSSTAPMAAAIASLVALAAEDLSVPALREAGIEASPALFLAAMSACSQWQVALRLLHGMRACELEPSTRAYNVAMGSCVKGGNWEAALSTFEEVVAPDVVSYGTVINACARGQQWQRALSLLGEMQRGKAQGGPAPNEFVLSAAINACGAAGQWQQALALLDTEKATGVPAGKRSRSPLRTHRSKSPLGGS